MVRLDGVIIDKHSVKSYKKYTIKIDSTQHVLKLFYTKTTTKSKFVIRNLELGSKLWFSVNLCLFLLKKIDKVVNDMTFNAQLIK